MKEFFKKYIQEILLVGGMVGLLLVGATSYVKADPMVDQVYAPSVRLDDSTGGFCSGQIVKSQRDDKTGKVGTYVLTAKHCVLDTPDGETIHITKENHDDSLKKTGETRYDAKVEGKSYKSDLALLKLVDDNTFFDKVAKVAPKDIKLTFGQTVEVVGYPVGLSMTWTEGKLGYKEEQPAFKSVSQSQLFFRATPDIVGGSSGSAMYTFNNNEYQIIGITTGGYQFGTFVNYFTPVDEINDYLDTALPKSDAEKKAAEEKSNSASDTSSVKKAETIKVYQ